MIVPKNHWFVIYSVDNFWLSEGEVLITQLLSHLLFINYFWGRNENYFYRSIRRVSHSKSSFQSPPPIR